MMRVLSCAKCYPLRNPFSSIPMMFVTPSFSLLHRTRLDLFIRSYCYCMKVNSHFSSLVDVVCKAISQSSASGSVYGVRGIPFAGHKWIHSTLALNDVDNASTDSVEKISNVDSAGDGKIKRPKLKGKRAVVRWLKYFRWKKKKEYQRMTAEEKILYKLRKAQKKQERLLHGLKKIDPAESSETTHDPEILTPEEHFYFLKMGLKCKNYVPIGRRGIYQGVILNMHLHWKKHQTLQVVVKTFSPEEVKEIASELARLSGGIVLDIHEENTIIMYRGKNYVQPPTEFMSPRVSLSRKKALDKSKYRDGLRSLRRIIPKLEQELELLQAQAPAIGKLSKANAVEETSKDGAESESFSNIPLESREKLKEIFNGKDDIPDDDITSDYGMTSDSEDLSDIFETDNETSDTETKETTKRPLYLDEFDKFPVEGDGEPEDFEEHLRQISQESRRGRSLSGKNADTPTLDTPTFDDIDQMFLRAASLLKRKKR